MKVFALFFLISAAMAAPRTPRIVGGETTTIEQYPYMSNMQLNWFAIFWAFSCGGSLITPVTVLSAAHCFHGDEPSMWRVRLGSTYISRGGSIHLVSELILHPGFLWSTLDYDVAIIRLAVPAIYSSSIRPARIISASSEIPDGQVVHAAGWGAIYYGGPTSRQLRHVELNVINQEVCAERYAHLKSLPGNEDSREIRPSMMCTGILDVGGRDACTGDSGGPIVIERDVIVGITSFGYSCADAFYPGVKSRVTSSSEWIAANA